MADSFFDTAGGLQQVPTVDIVEKPAQPYVATDGSMQSAVAVNVGAGGEIIEDGDPVTVKPANGVSPTYQGTFAHGTPPVVTLPATVALVPDAATTALLTHAGTNAGTITMNVNEGALTNASLADQTAVVSDGASVIISKADNTGLLATGAANVPPATDLLENVALPADFALVQNAGTVTVQNPDGSVSGDADATVTNNALNFAVLSGTIGIVANGGSVSMTDSAGANGKPGTFSVTGGFVPEVNLTAATDALVSDGFGVPLDGTASNAIINVAAGAITSVTPDPPITGGLQNGAAVNAKDQTDKTVAGTYDAANTEVDIGLGTVLVSNDDFVQVQNIDGSATVQGQASILFQAAAGADIILPVTTALASDQQALQIPVTGTYTNTATLTVSGGAITAITLS